jgi:tight adherence protein C
MSIYIVAALIMISIASITYALWPKEDQGTDAIKRRMRGQSGALAALDAVRARRPSVTKMVMDKVAPIAMRPVMITNPEQMSALRAKLAHAGYRQDNATTMFLASKTVMAVLGAGTALAYGLTQGMGMQQMVGITVFALAIGFMGPNLWLSMSTSKRQELVRNGLPDTLDLMVISVESGLGLDAAIQRVSDEMRLVHPALAEEMQIVVLESQMGIPRSEALTHLDERTGVSEVKSLVAMINQAERFGTSIAKALRNQSDVLRTKRRQRAEERAQQTTVKLMLPLIFFIFPAIMVVLGGPAALTMMEAFQEISGG